MKKKKTEKVFQFAYYRYVSGSPVDKFTDGPAIIHLLALVHKIVHLFRELQIVCFSVRFDRCQYYMFRYPWVPAYQGVITFFVIANFTLATFMDPGVIPKGIVCNARARKQHGNLFFFTFSPTWRRSRRWIPGAIIQECGNQWHHCANEMVCHMQILSTATMFALLRLQSLYRGSYSIRNLYSYIYNIQFVRLIYFIFSTTTTDIRSSLPMGQQLHWTAKLSILLLFPDIIVDPYAKHVFLVLILYSTSQKWADEDWTNHSVSFHWKSARKVLHYKQ